jgi:hypothetical protein
LLPGSGQQAVFESPKVAAHGDLRHHGRHAIGQSC